MPKTSAGLIMYRMRDGNLEVLLVHPGGPLWHAKENGAWTIPKGGIHDGESALAAAMREFEEETGFAPKGPFIELHSIQQKSGKIVQAWAFEGDCDPTRVRSNTFHMEWPPRSGKMCEFAEIDRAAFCGIGEAKRKINPAQFALLEELQGKVLPPS